MKHDIDAASTAHPVVAATGDEPRVLLVDDSAAQRQLLSKVLARVGYQVATAADAQEALAHLDDAMPTVVVCDWMMPGMSGPEFCERVRELDHVHYVYILILTSLQDDSAPAQALEVGADDFLTKPVKANELRARLRAGARVVRMQAELVAQHKTVSVALDRLQELYAAVERDLNQARALQHALLPAPECQFGQVKAGFMLQSAGKVGGDLVGHFPAGPGRRGIYSIDVSGHGVASAMLSVRMAGMFTRTVADDGLAMRRNEDGSVVPRSAVEIVRELNDRILSDIDTDLYLTLALVIFDEASDTTELVQAGHPHPLLRRADGTVESVGSGGLPVGMLFNADYETTELELRPGDQLFLQTDGFVECELPDGEMLGEAALIEMLQQIDVKDAPAEVLNILLDNLAEVAGTNDFTDDVSGVFIEISDA
ncbi:MAG: fused response regulator/phosphatase [Pseudomonadota bacterium]